MSRPNDHRPASEPAAGSTEPLDHGLGGAWGFGPGDLTSPVRAAAAGAIPDTALGDPFERGVTELRVHGVGGSNGPPMLEHPQAIQVAGDTTTMFYRRWSPSNQAAAGVSVPWRLEAYSWGGLTESALASASWIVLSPFMLYNVAEFALPPQDHSKELTASGVGGHSRAVDAPSVLHIDRKHRAAHLVLRLLALAATVQFTAAVATILVNGLALQARRAGLPSWLKWFPSWTVSERLTLALAATAAIVGVLWWLSVHTAHSYEERTTDTTATVAGRWPLTQAGFWNGATLVRRQRWLHSAAAAATLGLVLARPTQHHLPGLRVVSMWAAIAVLVVTVAVSFAPALDRTGASLGQAPANTGTLWTTWIGDGRKFAALGGTLIAIGLAAAIIGLCSGRWPHLQSLAHQPGELNAPATVPGLTGLSLVIIVSQAALLVVLAILVLAAHLTRLRVDRQHNGVCPQEQAQLRPFALGQLATALAALAVILGDLFGSLSVFFAARIEGAPFPNDTHFTSPGPHNPIQIPWPIFAFAAAPIGLLVGALLGLVLVMVRRSSHVRTFRRAGRATLSPIAEFYATGDGTQDLTGVDDDRTHGTTRRQVAKAWAVGLLVDVVDTVVVLAVGLAIAAVVVAEISGRHLVNDLGSSLHGLATIESWVGLTLAGIVVALLRKDYASLGTRKSVGAIWDVATFWPRANHPFAPPCYGERAIPELVDRVRLLAGVGGDPDDSAGVQVIDHRMPDGTALPPGLSAPAGRVLLTGYSQGSIIAPAVVAQLPDDILAKVALLTLACPARRLYGRAFPAYFGDVHLETLRTMTVSRWKNLVRRSDYIGSWVIDPARPIPAADRVCVTDYVDQPAWDPVVVAHDNNPSPPPTHYHSGFWPDARVTHLGQHLILMFEPKVPGPASGQTPTGENGGDLGAPAQAELGQDVRDVGLNRSGGDRQPAGDLAVGQAVGDQVDDVELGRGEALPT